MAEEGIACDLKASEKMYDIRKENDGSRYKKIGWILTRF